MIRLKMNGDTYRYGIGQYSTARGICIFNAMYYSYYSVNCGLSYIVR